jgi:hypothetical protein
MPESVFRPLRLIPDRKSSPEVGGYLMRHLVFGMFIYLVSLAICWLPESRAGVPTDSLWLKAVDLSEVNDDLVPGSMRMHMQEMDKHGMPKDEDKYYEYWSRLFLGEDGEVSFETIKVIENGKDITEEEKAKEQDREDNEDEDDESESHSMERYSPFDSEKQERMSVARIDTIEIVNGRDAVPFEFTEQTADEKVIRGTAWLEASSGVPIRVEYTTDPLPKRVKSMVTTLEYEAAGPDSLIVRAMSVKASGGFLFIKKHFQMDMTFADYWRLPEDYEADEAE